LTNTIDQKVPASAWRRRLSFDVKAWLWFLSSYAPLWLMLGLRFRPLPLRIGLFLVAIGGFVYVRLILRRREGELPSNDSLTITGDGGADVSGYLAAYLLPFLTVAEPSASDLAAYVIFMVVAGLVYVRSGLMQVNPTIYLFKYKVLRASLPVRDTAKEVFVITRADLRIASKLNAEPLGDRVYIDHSDVR
jgi:hypothetical protein